MRGFGAGGKKYKSVCVCCHHKLQLKQLNPNLSYSEDFIKKGNSKYIYKYMYMIKNVSSVQ